MTRLNKLNNAWHDYSDKHGKVSSVTGLNSISLCSTMNGRTKRYYIRDTRTGSESVRLTSHKLTQLITDNMAKGLDL